MKTNNEIKPVKVKVHRRPKTERKYERLQDVLDMIRVLEKHGDRIVFTYFDKERNLYDVTYASFAKRIKRIAAGLTEQGYAGKRIALIGETSVIYVIFSSIKFI